MPKPYAVNKATTLMIAAAAAAGLSFWAPADTYRRAATGLLAKWCSHRFASFKRPVAFWAVRPGTSEYILCAVGEGMKPGTYHVIGFAVPEEARANVYGGGWWDASGVSVVKAIDVTLPTSLNADQLALYI